MEMMPFSLLGFGFLLGVKHAFDADHVAAVSTFAAKNNSIKKSSLLGMFWGFGHAISLFFLGFIILLFKISIPRKVALSFEFIVGFMLVILGFNVLSAINKNKIHLHRHKHGKEEHIHFHSHKIAKKHEHSSLKKSLFIGIIHGLAGSAALTLLVLATINSIWVGLFYILIFGAGSIIGMALISSIISLPFTLIPKKLERTERLLKTSTGLISVCIGVVIIYNIGLLFY